MSNTYKDAKLQRKRRLVKEIRKRKKELGLSDVLYFECVDSELNGMMKELKNIQIELGIKKGFKQERRHSAAHRHAAMKNSKKCARINKHVKNRKELQATLKEDFCHNCNCIPCCCQIGGYSGDEECGY